MKFPRKLRSLFGRRRFDADLADEMRRHLEMQTEKNIAREMSPDEARNAARRGVREIGIRVALGATTEKIVGLFVRPGLRLAAIGLAVGSFGAAAVAVVLARLVLGVQSFDPIAPGGVVLFLTGAALLACWMPGRRAPKIDPMVALR